MSSARTYPVYPQKKYLTADSTQSALSLAAGRKAVTQAADGMYIGASTVHKIVPLDGARGATLQFFGTDANNEVITAVAIWCATLADTSGQTLPATDFRSAAYCDLALFGTLSTVTLSTAAGVDASDLVPATSFIADTITTWTPYIEAAINATYGLGVAGEFSPADNTPAAFIIPNFGAYAHGFVLEFDLGTAASANALYTLTA